MRRFVWAVLVLVASVAAPAIAARGKEGTTYALVSTAQVGDAAAVELLIESRGQLLIRERNETKPHDLTLIGRMHYEERLLALGDESLTGRRALRRYDKAEATITIDKQKTAQTLPEERRLIGVERRLDQTLVYCPQERLAREELDLLEVPGNSLLAEALLPGKRVPVGQTWPASDQALAGLVGIDTVSVNQVECKLAAVEGNGAKLEISGTLGGAIAGVSTEIELKGKAVFDLKSRRLTWLALLVREKRSVGHIGPGLEATARLQMKVRPLAEPEYLTDEVTAALGGEPADEQLLLEYATTAGGYRFAYDRRWHLISDEPGIAVLRLVDRGELVAQCNVSPVPATADRATTLEQFQQEIRDSLGKNLEELVEAAQGHASSGQTLFKVSAQGHVEGLPVQWLYYLVTHSSGRQVVFAFTMEGQHATRLGELDNLMVSSVEFAAMGEPTTASTPRPNMRR